MVERIMTTPSTNGQSMTAHTGDRANRLSAAKRALLELRLKNAPKPTGPAPIQPRQRTEAVPLSFAQELLWLLDQLNPNTSVYSVPRAMRIFGPLNVPALRRT